MAAANSINEGTTGVTVFTGTSFTGYPITEHNVLTAGAANAINSVAPSTSGNVLTSNGTDWISSAAPGGGILTAHFALTSAQIKLLNSVPQTIVAAPAAGNVIIPLIMTAVMNYGGTNPFTGAAGQTVAFYYGTTAVINIIIPNAILTASASEFGMGAPTFGGGAGGALSAANGVALNLYNSSATEIAGNAAGNNTINGTILYYIMPIT